MNHFIPVKITDKQWADRLIQGEVYMRALHEFGLWGNVDEKDPVLKNDFRGDPYSGITATFKTPDDIATLNFPEKYISSLTWETVENYLAECEREDRNPFPPNFYSRKCELSWYD